METFWYSNPRTHSLFLNNLRYLDNMQAHNMMFPHMRDFQLLNVSSRNFNSMNYHFSLPLKEASSRVSYLDIKKGTKTLKSLTISSCKKKRHTCINRIKYKTHYIIFSILILLHHAEVQSLPSPLHSDTLHCHAMAEQISHTSYT